VVGRPVRKRRYLLMRAQDELTEESGTVFESVFNTGYRRMPIGDVHLVGVRTRRRIRRISHRHIKRMSSAVRLTNRVPQKASLGINKEIAVLGVIAAIARDAIAAKGAPEETAKGTANLPPPIAVVAQRLIDALR
jgi:hypothetical protein